MALVYRQTKGEALTFAELDGNFQYFTGSHAITGSLIISGSILPGSVSSNLGSVDAPFKDLYLSNSTLYFVSSSVTSSFAVNASGSMSGSYTGSFGGTFSGSYNGTGSGLYFVGLPTSSTGLSTGSLWVSGSNSGSGILMVYGY